jgi:acyl carrier protein
MIRDHIISETRTFVVENFLYARPDYALGVDDSLLQAGIMDSMGVIELVEFVQTAFGVEVKDNDITEANLGSLSAIASYVSSRLPSNVRDQHAA